VVDAVEPQVREMLRARPTMPVTVIAERMGWQDGSTVLTTRLDVARSAVGTSSSAVTTT